MTLGNVVAVSQRSVKRMLAYSSIAHTGYVLVGLSAFTGSAANQQEAVSSVLFYLFSYLFMNMGAFGVIVWLQRQGGTDFLQDFRGLPTKLDGRGNYTIGVREQTIFPEIDYDAVDQTRGLDITITTSAQTDEEGFALLEMFGMPFVREGRPGEQTTSQES
jgi:hypothetical protein